MFERFHVGVVFLGGGGTDLKKVGRGGFRGLGEESRGGRALCCAVMYDEVPISASLYILIGREQRGG